MSRILLALFLIGCAPDEPTTGYGIPDVTEVDGEEWVDTDGDDVPDVPLAEWCHPTVLEDPQTYREATYSIRETIPGFSELYTFKLESDGTVAICYEEKERRDRPITWACRDGEIDVYASGALALWAGPHGVIASIAFGDYIWGDPADGIRVIVTGGKDGREAEGNLFYLDSGCG